MLKHGDETTPCQNKMKTNLNASVYRWNLGDCTKGGISSKAASLNLYYKSYKDGSIDATGFPNNSESRALAAEIFKKEKDALIVIEDDCYGRRLRAIPVSLYSEKKWDMFGGNFAWTSDSLFFKNPVKIFDRYEGDSNSTAPTI